MAVVCEDSDPDLLAYTRLWIERVNRGSLFPLNDETFHFFVQVEMVVCVLLPKHDVKVKSNEGVQDVIEKILEDKDVQFNWTLILQDLDSYERTFIRSCTSVGNSMGILYCFYVDGDIQASNQTNQTKVNWI